MSVQQIREYCMKHWQTLVAYGGTAAVVLTVLFWELGTLVPGYSAGEAQSYQVSQSWHAIASNPLNAPYFALIKLLTYIHPDSYLVTRLVSAGIGLFTLVVFTLLLRHWHDDRTAIIGTLLFGLSAWFLHTARLGTPSVTLFGVFIVVACGFWLKHTNSWLALFACFVGVAWLLYIPGMPWFVLAGFIWQFKAIDRVFKRHLLAVTGAGIALLGSLIPLAWGLYKHHDLIKPFLALPAQWPTPVQMVKNLLLAPYHLLVHNAADPATWLGTASIFDIFSLAMLVLGGYLYLRHWRLARTPIFILILLVSAALMAIGSPITFSVVIPFLYVVIATGATYLLDMWFKVFPRNPIARSLGWGLIGIAVTLSCAYQLTHYFVGWPQASATQAVFTVHKP